MPPKPICNGQILTSGTTVLPNTTYYADGGTIHSVNLNGGTIIICSGTTTFSGNFNSGAIYIKKGAIFNTNINVIGTGCSIYNYGRSNFTAGLFINTAIDVMNAIGGTITVNGNIGGNGCSLINYGSVTGTGQLGDWQNSGGVCQGNGASIAVSSVLWHSLTNWIQTPVGSSCLSYSSTALSNNNHSVSDDSGTNICQKASASNEVGNGSWGNASVNTNCSSCPSPPCDPTDTVLAAFIPSFCTNNGTLDLSNYANAAAPGSWSIVNGPVEGNSAQIAANGFTLNINNTAGGLYTIQHTLVDPGIGCPDNSKRTIKIFSLPAVSLNLSDSLMCLNESPVAITQGTPSLGNYEGTGLQNGNIFSPANAGQGTHTITYTYTDENSCSNNAAAKISVFNPDLVKFNLPDSLLCINDGATALTGGIPQSGNYNGLGVVQNIFSPDIAGVGTHTITYAYNFNNACIVEATDKITVLAKPAVTFNLSDKMMCVNENPLKIGVFSPAGGILSGNGVSNGNFNPSLANLGTHSIKYFYSDVQGCKDSVIQLMEVNAVPIVTFNLVNDIICSNNKAITISGVSPLDGKFTGSGVVGNKFDPSILPLGTKTITYVYIDDKGCAGTATDNITVNQAPMVAINDISICENQWTTFDAGAGYTTYQWSGLGTGNQQELQAASAGKYTVTVSNQFNCTASDSAVLTVNLKPTPDLGDDMEICEGDAITLDPKTKNNLHYSWTPAGTASTFNTTTGGKYKVNVSDDIGCTGSDSIAVLAHPLPFAIASNDSLMCNNEFDHLTLSVQYTGSKSTEWSTSTFNTDSIVIYQTGNYWVKVTDSNSCTNQQNILISEFCKDVTIDYPNVITPNGDNLNDFFYPKNVNNDNELEILANIDFFDFEVYDRWGSLLFHTYNSIPKWDGTYKGQLVSSGTYYWTLSYKNKANKMYQIADYITVIY